MRVRNRITSHIVNELDFFIRFLYCRLTFLKKLVFWNVYSSDFEQLDRSFEIMRSVFERHGISIKGKTILEIGPGNSKITGYNLINHGAKEVVLLDKFPRFQNSKRQRKFQDDELEFISRKYNLSKQNFSNGLLRSGNIRFLPCDLCDSDLVNVDIIISKSVLEHVKDIEATIECMSKILGRGGYMYHNIDLRDHYNFESPFLFYKYEEDIWNKYLTKEGVSYTNRLRYDEYMDLFKKHSFEVVSEDIVSQDLGSVRLSPHFAHKRKGDLEVCTLRVLLRKPCSS